MNPGDLPHDAPHEKSYSWLPILEGLTENAEWNRDLIEHSHDLLCIHDLEGRLLSINPRPAQLLGYTVEELLRIPLRRLLAPRFQSQFDEYLGEIAGNGEASGLMVVVTRAGEERTWEFHNTLRTSGVSAPLVRGVAHDVTERIRIEKELRESVRRLSKLASEQELMLRALQLFRALLDNSNDAIEVIDPKTMRFLDVNQRACSELGYTRDELLSMSVFDIDPKASPESVAQGWAHLLKVGFLIIESEHRRKNGTTFPVEVNLRRVVLDKEYIVAVSRDVTERKLHDTRLREFERVVESLEEMIVVVDRDSRYVLANRAFLRRHGLSKDEVIGHAAVEVLHAEAYESVVKSRLNEAFEGKAVTYEMNYRYRELGERQVSITYLPIEGTTGIDRVAAIIRDVTDRNRAEEQLRRSESRYRSLVEATSDMVWVIGPSGQDIDVNSWLEFTGLTLEEARKNWWTPIHPDDRERVLSAWENFVKNGGVYEIEYHVRRRDGEYRLLAVRGVPVYAEDGSVREWIGTFSDVTDSRRAAAALEESERRFRAVHDRAPVGIALVESHTGRFLKVNPRYCEIIGRSEQEMLRLRFQDITHPEDLTTSDHQLAQMIEEKLSGYDLEKRYLRPDGSVVWVNLSVVPMWEPGEQIRWQMSIVQDITASRMAEEALRESEERMRLAQQAAGIGVFERNMRTGGSQWSPEMEAIFGLPAGMAPPTVEAFMQLVHPDDREPLQRAIDKSVETGTSATEWRVVWPDGSLHWVAGRWRMFKDKDGRPLRAVGVDIDITDRKRAEEALRESEERLRLALESAQLGSWEHDHAQDTTVRNLRHDQIFGHPSLLPHWNRAIFLSHIAPEDRETVKKLMEQNWTHKAFSEECRIIWPDRSVHWILTRGRTYADDDGKPVKTLGTVMDITERKFAEDALRESEERMRLAQEVAHIGTFDRNLITGEARWTPQMERMYGLPPAAAPQSLEQFYQLLHPNDQLRIREVIERSMQTGEGHGEWRVIWPNGSVHWITGRWRVFKDSNGKPVRAVGIDYDITNRKRTEHELRVAKERLTEEKLYLEHEIDTEFGFEEIIGKSPALKAVMESAGKVASSDASVLLLGETGTGKELIARAIHRLSQRAGNAFIKMNCAAIPSGLLESELFGAEKGAFTGATSRKIGRLELADKGTMFLDEIGEIALSLQPKLLRVLQDQEFERLGGTRTLKVDFRLIAATNRDLGEQVRENQFRRDLYYRLNVFPIHLPALRNRREDIPMLVEHFVQKCAHRMGKSIKSIPTKTMDTLIAWHWPGNVRELENFVERSVILTNGSVLAAPLSELQSPVSAGAGQNETLEAAERRHILEALRQSNGRISGVKGAAARLGLKRTTLQSKLKQMGINPRTPPTN